MPKQTIEVEVPVGWRAVGYRAPKQGENYLSLGCIVQCVSPNAAPWLVIEREWIPPAYIREGIWMAMDEDGGWWFFLTEPRLVEEDGEWDGDAIIGVSGLQTMIDFTPPPCTDWRQSKRRIQRAS